jgi:hypothetical protein
LVVPAAVGAPEISPALLNERPAGSEEPLAKAQVSVPEPPLACKASLYAVPVVPLDNVVVMMLGAGATTTVDEMDLVVSAIDVAVIATVISEETVAGAL